jgi:hypothetical protein
MCCFSVWSPGGFIARLFTPKVRVSQTNIFARMVRPGSQVLAYGMNLSTTIEVAMVLPLPVAIGSGEDAVRFIDLSAHPRMFEDLESLFLMLLARKKSGGPRLFVPKLVVHEVGSFIASYVPTRADFARLDERFQMPDVLFDAVPQYADYGFAVFQLLPGTVTVHPIGLSFPTREPDKLFFPTVHLHDGRFHAKAKFDHSLYYQRPSEREIPELLVDPSSSGEVLAWQKPRNAYADVVDVELAMLRQRRRGRHPNADIWLTAT